MEIALKGVLGANSIPVTMFAKFRLSWWSRRHFTAHAVIPCSSATWSGVELSLGRPLRTWLYPFLGSSIRWLVVPIGVWSHPFLRFTVISYSGRSTLAKILLKPPLIRFWSTYGHSVFPSTTAARPTPSAFLLLNFWIFAGISAYIFRRTSVMV